MKSLFFAFCLISLPVVAWADTASTLTYDVYAGGIHAMDAQLALDTKNNQYKTTLTAGTRGFLKKVANWSGEFSSKGLLDGRKAQPLSHKSASTWKGKTESKTFTYDGHGKFLSYKVDEDGKNKTPKDVDLSLAKGTSDMLTSTLNLMLGLPAKQACEGNQLVFDGDRNYRLVFANTKTENFKKTDYNAYEGPAISCTVEVKPEQGKWRKKPRGWLSIQEQGRQKGSLPTVWFAKVGDGAYYAPVKIRVKTDYGTLFMHLTSIK